MLIVDESRVIKSAQGVTIRGVATGGCVGGGGHTPQNF